MRQIYQVELIQTGVHFREEELKNVFIVPNHVLLERNDIKDTLLFNVFFRDTLMNLENKSVLKAWQPSLSPSQ